MKHGVLHPDGRVTDVVELDPTRCPHFIMVPEHYRVAGDGSCRCDDPEHKEMLEWGYLWASEFNRWM